MSSFELDHYRFRGEHSPFTLYSGQMWHILWAVSMLRYHDKMSYNEEYGYE